MTGQMSERDELARVAYRAWRDGQRGGPTSDAELDATFSRTEFGWMQAVADAALAWFAEHRAMAGFTVKVGDPAPSDLAAVDDSCDANTGGYLCTRQAGHRGPHVATDGTTILAVTPTTESEDR